MEYEYFIYFLQHAFVHSPLLQKYGKVSESKTSDKLTMCFVMTTFKIHLICTICILITFTKYSINASCDTNKFKSVNWDWEQICFPYY